MQARLASTAPDAAGDVYTPDVFRYAHEPIEKADEDDGDPDEGSTLQVLWRSGIVRLLPLLFLYIAGTCLWTPVTR